MNVFTPITSCASCLTQNLSLLHDFGIVPLAGYFPIAGSQNQRFLIPLSLLRCNLCGLVQVTPSVEDSILFSDYRYLSGFAMKRHFEELANWIVAKFGLESKVLEIGSNDGTLMDELAAKGFDITGVDPAENVTDRAKAKGHKVYNDYFSPKFILEHGLTDSYELVISCNSFAHISNIREICEGISLALRDKGSFIVEVQAWPELVKHGAFDFVYHEHRYYYDLNSISNLLLQFNLFLCQAEMTASHGNSYRLIFEKNGSKDKYLMSQSQEIRYTEEEITQKIEKFNRAIFILQQKLIDLKAQGKKVIAFGASGRGNMILGHLDFQGLIKAVYDESPERVGRTMGFTDIPVSAFNQLKSEDYDVCVILAWNHADAIIKKWPHGNKKLLKPLPELLEVLT